MAAAQWAIALVLVAAIAAPVAPAHAQEIHGEIGLYSKYLDYDLFVLTDEPVVQAGLFPQLTDRCVAMIWGSHGIATSQGGELDVGARCHLPLGEGEGAPMASGYVMRSFLRGYRDSWTFAGALHYGGAEVSLEHFLWDGHPGGTRVTASYRHTGIERVALKPVLAYETGLGIADIFAGGLNAEYALSRNLSLVALAMVPLIEDKSGFRSEELMVGMRYGF